MTLLARTEVNRFWVQESYLCTAVDFFLSQTGSFAEDRSGDFSFLTYSQSPCLTKAQPLLASDYDYEQRKDESVGALAVYGSIAPSGFTSIYDEPGGFYLFYRWQILAESPS